MSNGYLSDREVCVVTSECFLTTNPPFRTLTTAALLDNVSVESRTFKPPQMLIFSGRLRESNRKVSLQRPKVVAVVYDFPTAFGFRFYLCVLNRFKRSGRLRELVACRVSTVLSITFDR